MCKKHERFIGPKIVEITIMSIDVGRETWTRKKQTTIESEVQVAKEAEMHLVRRSICTWWLLSMAKELVKT